MFYFVYRKDRQSSWDKNDLDLTSLLKNVAKSSFGTTGTTETTGTTRLFIFKHFGTNFDLDEDSASELAFHSSFHPLTLR